MLAKPSPGPKGPAKLVPQLDRALVWMRRDLRVQDHAALYHALRQARHVWCVFIFDTHILAPLLAAGRQADRRVEFIHDSIVGLDAELRALAQSHGIENAGLVVRHGAALACITQLAEELRVQAVFANWDDEPGALARDAQVRGALAAQGAALHLSKDHVIFGRAEVLTQSGTPFSVFTPYKQAWLKALTPYHLKSYPVARYAGALAPRPTGPSASAACATASPAAAADSTSAAHATAIPSLESMGFARSNLHSLRLPSGPAGGAELWAEFQERMTQYGDTRNFPAVKGPSYLGTHLRFGTVSIRALAREAVDRTQAGDPGAQVWLSELIWRDFYHQVLFHHPHVATRAFKPAYDRIEWEKGKHAKALFSAWCEARTGYPLVDAAMQQINQTGYMHNRLRMVVASFLTKDLGIDWRWGEAYFALHLNDFDLAANNGGWQWAASSGCDAQPYFRIFNPINQSEKFDPDGRFIRRYVPQLAALPDKLIHAPWLAKPLDLLAAGVKLGSGADCNYPLPVVDHAAAREKTLTRYAVVKALA
jgi:deoxyribodipyrimidine photo-lyase